MSSEFLCFWKFQQTLAFLSVAFLPHHAIVLRPEMLAQILAAKLAGEHVNEGCDDNCPDYDQQYHNLS
jgi:hypothetical protein